MSQMPANSEMARITSDMPNVDSPAGLEKKDRRSAKDLARFIEEHYQGGLDKRRAHATSWLSVMSIMRNIHYFKIYGGQWRPLKKKTGEIRAVKKIMKPRFRWEMGRLNSNQIGLTVTPKIGQGENAYLWAERTKAIMPDWLEEADVPGFFDTANQLLLYFGLVGYYRYIDLFHRQVRLEPIPGPELFPIPYDAPSFEKSDGIMRVNMVSKQWLEMQDESLAAERGDQSFPRMAQKATTQSISLTTDFSGIGSVDKYGGRMTGATVKTIWMKRSPVYPQGAWMFFVEDELFRIKLNEDEKGKPLFNGKIPIEPVYYTKRPDDFWGDGFCEDMISEQLEANRQLTDIIINARRNRALTIIDGEAIDPKDVQDSHKALIVTRGGSFDNRVPIAHFPAASLSRDVGAILELVEQGADKAVGFESNIIFGKQEGRTEGGPATNILNTNAQQPLQPVLDRIFRAFQRTFPEVLDMLRTVWPDEKLVKSPGELGREMLIKRDDVPSSSRVSMSPSPLVAGGRQTMLQLLLQLRQTPSDDGKGFEVSSAEMRRSLRLMNMNPPGLELVDEVEQRINVRIGLLINDGKKPAIAPATLDTAGELRFENHTKAVELLKKAVLDPGYRFFGPNVKNALLEEMKFHGTFLASGFAHPDKFDDDVEDEDARFSERVLDSEEQDLGSLEAHMSLDGVPVGVGV